MDTINAWTSRLDRWLVFAAGAALAYMMTMTVADIVSRSLSPFTIASSVEQTELAMLVVGFLGLARCLRTDGNITIDVLSQHFPDRLNRWIDTFWLAVTAVLLGFLAWAVLRSGLALDADGQRSELLGLSPLAGHAVAALGLAAAAAAAAQMVVMRLASRR
ncbi:MAG: TRAP transporter small permease [Alphaproteobacteria bacterium]|jgi:TRAP-type C4-dicarboxylate transport system permease small subunit|nr:TRAP transporter small permease [Alphaproteobacteria bacterium]